MRFAITLAFSTLLASAQVVVFENVNVVPMDRNRVLQRQDVVVRDGRIAFLGPAGKASAPTGATRIEATGKYLMPGLAEMHGHLPLPNSSQELVEHILFLYVANGVTTVRGMLGYPSALEHKAAIAAGRLLGPRLYVAGPGLSGNAVKTVEQGVQVVREQKQAGYDLLKIQEGLAPNVYEAIAKTAKEVRIDFAGHVPNDVGVRKAIAAGQRSVDHLDNYLEALEADNSPVRNADAATKARELPFHVDERKMGELAQVTRKAGAWNMPTMALWEFFLNDATGDELRKSLPELRYMPRSTVDQWTQRKNAMVAQSHVFMGFHVGGKTGARVIELRKKMLKALRDAGALIALGTDSPQVFSVPGFSLHREMKAMLEAGFTPYEVLESGTSKVAEYFGTQQESGTVEAGKVAGLILLDANPLSDLANVARRAGVMIKGRWIPEQEIQQRLEKLAAAAEKM
ncbi:MAG: amidohydrolase family protein [Acidimicrobiia bacterium]|nr:amidohydrolase family protein [Acidimicrobiia bacterium]